MTDRGGRWPRPAAKGRRGSSGPAGAVVGVAGEEARRAVELFGEHSAHEEMRPSGAAESEPPSRAVQHGAIKPLGAADGESRGPPRLGQAGKACGESLSSEILAVKIERNQLCPSGKSAQHRLSLAAACLGWAAASLRNLNQARGGPEPGGVPVEQRLFRTAPSPPHCEHDDRRNHALRTSPGRISSPGRLIPHIFSSA